MGTQPWVPWALAGTFILAMVLARLQVYLRNKKNK